MPRARRFCFLRRAFFDGGTVSLRSIRQNASLPSSFVLFVPSRLSFSLYFFFFFSFSNYASLRNYERSRDSARTSAEA